MDDFGAKEKAEASNQNPEKIRARQPQEKRSPDGSETLAEAEASDKRKMIKPVHKRQKQCTDETKHAVCSSNKLRTRGRRPTLTKDQKRENKKQSCRRFRERKNAKHKELEEKCQELEKEKKTLEEEMKELMKQTGMEKEALQSEINSLKACMNSKEEELPEIVRADKLKREMSNDVNMLRMLNKVMEPNLQTLQQNILSQDNQETHVEDFELDDIEPDWKYLDKLGLFVVEEYESFRDPQSDQRYVLPIEFLNKLIERL